MAREQIKVYQNVKIRRVSTGKELLFGMERYEPCEVEDKHAFKCAEILDKHFRKSYMFKQSKLNQGFTLFWQE